MLVMNKTLQKSLLWSVLLNIFVSDLKDMVKYTLVKFEDGAKSGVWCGGNKGKVAIQRDLTLLNQESEQGQMSSPLLRK